MAIQTVNPADGVVVKEYPEMTPAEVDAAVRQAHDAWSEWRSSSFGERARLMKAAGAALRRRKAELARLMATEMGKPLYAKLGFKGTNEMQWSLR